MLTVRPALLAFQVSPLSVEKNALKEIDPVVFEAHTKMELPFTHIEMIFVLGERLVSYDRHSSRSPYHPVAQDSYSGSTVHIRFSGLLTTGRTTGIFLPEKRT